MPRYVTAASISALFVAWASLASAQTFVIRPVLVGRETSARDGRVHGVVRDDIGRAVAGASVIAVGGAVVPVAARSDVDGQFVLVLQPGAYVLRANLVGYVSTYREPVTIQSRTELERNIVLVRRTRATETGPILTAAAGPPIEGGDIAQRPAPAPDEANGNHSHSETAWRLRHLTPTALREIARTSVPPGGKNAGVRPQPSFVDWMMVESARAAASFFLNTDFSGQVNFLTTSSLAATPNRWLPTDLPRGIAYLAVGAPVGSAGDWSVRGAMSASELSSWVVLGEYVSRHDQAHALRVGVSYSSQPMAVAREPVLAVNDHARSAGGVYGFDRWQVHPALELDYGLRLDRYDYASDSQFLSPRFGFRLRTLARTFLTVLASQSSVAPGANEFLPPMAGGVWLPPERTFSPLLPGSSFRAERVRDVEFGVEHRLARDADAPVVALKRFRQTADDQVATLYGLDAERDVGHYYVATPGNVSADGWTLRLSGPLTRRVSGAVGYTTSLAEWIADADAAAIAMIAPQVVRPDRERFQDVTASVNATIPESATRVTVAYRVSAARSADPIPTQAVAVGRFDVEVRQGLPLRPTRGSKTELVVLFRNLSRDIDDPGSLYDEMLTIAPPLRIMGGVQVKF